MNPNQPLKIAVITLALLTLFACGQSLQTPSATLERNSVTTTYLGTYTLPTPDYSDLHPEEYRIVYALVPDAVPSDSIVSPDNALGSITQARIASSMEDILRYDEERPIEALIVHPSAFDFLDLEWTKQATRRSVVMMNINGYEKESGILRGNLCDQQSERPLIWQDSDYYFSVVNRTWIEDPIQQEEAERSFHEDCVDIGFTLNWRSQGPIQNEQDILGLVFSIITGIKSASGFDEANALRGLPATMPPPPIMPTETP